MTASSTDDRGRNGRNLEVFINPVKLDARRWVTISKIFFLASKKSRNQTPIPLLF